MLKSDTRGLRVAEKRAVVKFIVVVVASSRGGKGNEGRRASRLYPVDCQNSRSLCRFYSRSLAVVTSVKPKLFRARPRGGRDFFEKSRTRLSCTLGIAGVFRTTGPSKHMARKRRRKTFTPWGAHVVPRRHYIRIRTVYYVVPWRPGDAHTRLSYYVFPGMVGKIRRQPYSYGGKVPWIFDKRIRLQKVRVSPTCLSGNCVPQFSTILNITVRSRNVSSPRIYFVPVSYVSLGQWKRIIYSNLVISKKL